ncbi:MAG: hypothetical protein ABH835_03170 [Patescibacteria group bacterium]
MNDIAERIKQSIKEKDLKPRSKKYFIIKQILLWALLGWVLIIISLAMALGWEISVQQDFKLVMALPNRFLFVIKTLPYFWMVLAITLGVIALVEFKGTNKGYKLQWYFILIALIIANLFLAGIFYFTGVAQLIENRLEAHLPGYHRVVVLPHEMWLEVEDGLLSGIIIEGMEECGDCVILEDWDENEWEVVLEDETLLPPFIRLEKNEAIRVIGEEIGRDKFRADVIKPWERGFEGRGDFFETNPMPPRGGQFTPPEINNFEPAYY